MFGWFKKSSKTNKIKEECSLDSITTPSLSDIRHHFETLGQGYNENGFRENQKIVEDLRNNYDLSKKNIFIVDDMCEISEILKDEITVYLEKTDKIDKINVITMCGKRVGFDMLSLIANHSDIKIDYLITDITFGCNEIFDGKKIIIDGVDLVILLRNVYPTAKYILFTGNILSENNVKSYNFARKFNKYTNECILNHAIIKDTDDAFNDEKCEQIVRELYA